MPVLLTAGAARDGWAVWSCRRRPWRTYELW